MYKYCFKTLLKPHIFVHSAIDRSVLYCNHEMTVHATLIILLLEILGYLKKFGHKKRFFTSETQTCNRFTPLFVDAQERAWY